MKRVSMVARKMLRYGTRRLRAGDTFEAARMDAIVLAAVGLAVEAPRPTYATRALKPEQTKKIAAALVDRPVAAAAPPADAGLDALRAEYTALTGKKPHHLWRAPRLQAEIAAAKGEPDAAE